MSSRTRVTRYGLLEAVTAYPFRTDEAERFDAALEAAATRLGYDLTNGPPLQQIRVRIDAPGAIQALGERWHAPIQCHRALSLSWPEVPLIILPVDWDWYLGSHEAGHVLAFWCGGYDKTDPMSETQARRAEGPGVFHRLFGRQDPWTGPRWVA